MGDSYSKPNVILDLAPSYDTRNVASDTKQVAGYDQRKINCFYDIVANSVTGRATLELTKRPGFSAGLAISAVAGTAYTIVHNTTNSGATPDPWVASWNGTIIRVCGGGTATTVLTSSSHVPAYMDITSISGTTNVVLQLRGAINTYRTFYSASDNSVWTEISDTTYTGLSHRGKMEFMDGFAFQLDRRGRIYNSAINTLATWDDDNYITKTIQADNPLGLAHFGNQIIAFGGETAEVFVNAGNSVGSPLRSVPELAAKVGMGSAADVSLAYNSNPGVTHYYTEVGGKMYFVGGATIGPGSLALYRYDGRTFTRISSGAINRILANNDGDGSAAYYSVGKVYFQGREAVSVQLSAPTASTQRWLMYFPDVNEWFEWSSTLVSPVSDGTFFLPIASGGTTLYNFEGEDNWQDVSTPYTMTVQFKMPKGGNNRDVMDWCGVESDTTSSAVNLAVSFSDDDYANFSTARNIDLSSLEKRITRCGSYKNRAVRLSNSDNAEVRLRKFMARVR
jgi:hypothetical protein